ncbi:recA bacterial DNA recombination family protein, partial [Vibrio parahaemolyticus V-223/04]
QVKQR